MFKMWRQQAGITEMLFTYIGDYQAFSSWSNWRTIVTDILTCHEEVRRQRIESACTFSAEPATPAPVQKAKPSKPELKEEDADDVVFIDAEDFEPKRSDILIRDAPQTSVLPSPARHDDSTEDTGGQLRLEDTGETCVKEEDLLVAHLDQVQTDVGVDNVYDDRTVEEALIRQHSSSTKLPPGDISSQWRSSDTSRKCRYCPETFRLEWQKIEHEQSHSTGVIYFCRICERRFSELLMRRMHEKSHTEQYIHSCQFCGKICQSRNGKVIHERTHTGEKPYSCAICPKRFGDQSTRNRHQKLHKYWDAKKNRS